MKISKLLGLTLLLGAQIADAEPITLADFADSVQVYSRARALTVHNGIEAYSDVTDGTKTSVYSESQTSELYGSGQVEVFNGGYTFAAAAKSYANLATGKVGASAYDLSSTFSFSPYGKLSNIGAIAEAGYTDYVQFHIAGANSDTVTNIPFSLAVDGDFYYGRTQASQAQITLSLADVSHAYGQNANPTPGLSYYQVLNHTFDYGPYFYASGQEGSLFGPFTDPDPDSSVVSQHILKNNADYINSDFEGNPTNRSYDFDGVLTLYGADPIWSISMSILALNADFYNTSAFTFVLPDNVTFQSASGKFLSEVNPPSAVPTPAALPLMLSALGVFVFARRKV